MNAVPPPTDPSSSASLARLKIQMQAFPHQAGVYLMRDISGKVLYVGKAKDLRKRVLSYLKASGIKTIKLLDRAETIECILTDNEKEALILESNLIKKHRPRYNVDLRDDKRYPCLRLDPQRTLSPAPGGAKDPERRGRLFRALFRRREDARHPFYDPADLPPSPMPAEGIAPALPALPLLPDRTLPRSLPG